MSIDRDLPTEQATQALGRTLATSLRPPLMIALKGDLGAGKTTLARALIQTLLPDARVKSPTYTLVESYAVPFGDIHHFDLYRLVDPDELEQIDLAGFAGANAVLLIEWPEKGGERTAHPDLSIELIHQADGRGARISAHSAAGEALMRQI